MVRENDVPLPLRNRTSRASLPLGKPCRTPKILCVDDDEGFLAAFSALLEMAGFAVATASNPANGLAFIRSSPFDLAILDYHMPGMNGAQLAREIRQYRPDMPLMLFSANESVPAGELRVFDRYLAKGENFREVLLAVRAALPLRKTAMTA